MIIISQLDQQEPELNRQGAELLRRVFPMLSRLANAGTERDKARNRRLHYSQYAGLILLGLFNPLLQSSRALVAASGLRNVRKLTGGRQVSLGSFSEASSVFDPQLLAGVVGGLRTQWGRQTARRLFLTARKSGAVSNALLERLVAVDASVLSALPQLVARFSDPRRGQWRLHAHVLDGAVLNAEVTPEPAAGDRSERAMLEQMLSRKNSPTTDESSALYLMDRGYRSALLFNRIRATGADYVCRLNRVDGRLVQEPPRNARGEELVLPPLSAAGRAAGVVADEWITLGISTPSSSGQDPRNLVYHGAKLWYRGIRTSDGKPYLYRVSDGAVTRFNSIPNPSCLTPLDSYIYCVGDGTEGNGQVYRIRTSDNQRTHIVPRNQAYSGANRLAVVDGRIFFCATRVGRSYQTVFAVSEINDPPVVTGIVREAPTPALTNAASVAYTVAFDTATTDNKVAGLDTGNFSLTTTGISNASITSVSPGPTSFATSYTAA